MADLVRTPDTAKVPRVILSIMELQQTCLTSQTNTVASSVVWVVPFAVIISDGVFDF